ncbi:MAG: putative PhzC/PhzF related epimerase [halophilic archaeon J07HX5]|jgi:Predicted epimerase, PhzC/PhzF homolog|nr:MAG: putative PhzC/PhzF related epimerase [halophilic archaeon J07HX5]
MNTVQLVQIDVFADEPLGGVPVAVVLDAELSERQCRRVGAELGVAGVVTHQAASRVVPVREHIGIEAAVATATALFQRDRIPPGEHSIETPSGKQSFELATDGAVSNVGPRHALEYPTGLIERTATALGLDPATLKDVGADLPPGIVEAAGGTLSVAVNFFQHLSGASAGPLLGELLESIGAKRLCLFTFDTPDRGADVHARVFTQNGTAVSASAAAAAACGAHLADAAVFDPGRTSVVIASGSAVDRPARLTTTLDAQPRLTGRGLTGIDGTLSLPPDDDDEILEA